MTIKQSWNEPSGLAWFKSSYSGGNGGECVEVASVLDAVHIRDSKDKTGPQLTVTPGMWRRFVEFAAEC